MQKIILIFILIIFNLYAKNNTNIPILLDNTDYKIYVKPDGNLAFLGCYADALKFNSNGLAPVSLEGDTWTFINDTGQKINKKTFDSIDEFATNGLAAASKNGQYGYIDINGNWIIKPKFDEAYKFDTVENNLSLAMAWIGEKHGYINQKGEWIIKPIFGSHYDTGFENGVAMVSPENSSLYGLIDSHGKWILAPKYDWDTSGDVKTHKGHFTLMENEKWGVIDTQGKWIVKPKYDYIIGAVSNAYIVELRKKKYVINLKDKFIEKVEESNEIKNVNGNYIYESLNLVINKKLGELLTKTNDCNEFIKQAKNLK